MTEFRETDGEYKVEHMTEEYGVWNTLQTFRDYEKAVEHAEDYAQANPDTEVRVTELLTYNY